ncbi:hypothetical protein U8527_14510 [Kordia algicida OT-1]|uniref:hypothetical protein n=1 Tax=Kordia algicida TaxID=221066 RepID=UPI0012F947FF|nr:hypothetical protein [Kordia algicida]
MCAQTSDFSELYSLEDNEQVTIDIIIGGCFHVSTNAKVFITKKETFYEFIYIENIYKIIKKIDRNLLLYRDKLKKWIDENTETLAKYGARKIITEEQYQSKIKLLHNTIKGNKGRSSRFAGDFSIIKINSKRLQLKESFSCKIVLNLQIK